MNDGLSIAYLVAYHVADHGP